MRPEAEVRKGTTTVGLLCTDGVVFASERRATIGNLIANKDMDKVIKIQDHCAMTVAGDVGDAQTIARLLKVNCNLYEIQRGKKISIEAAGTFLSNVLQGSKYFPYWIMILLGGYDNAPRIYSLGLDGSMIPEKFVSTGSGSPVAYGVLENMYKEGKPIKENICIAVKAIKAAMERDVMSGNGINVAVIDKKGYKKLSDDEIKAEA